jgi:LacI family transcriptional regulator
MEQLAYRPNAAARALKLACTNVIGLAVNAISNPFFAEFARYLQNIAFDAGDPTLRHQSWLDAMGRRMSPKRLRELQEQDEFNERGGYQAALRLLDGKRKRPRALVVASDVQAFGVLRATYELRLTIPDDLAVISFDGTVASQFTCRALSVVQLPVENMAKLSFRKLVDGDGDLEARTTLPHRLVVRESCGNHPS